MSHPNIVNIYDVGEIDRIHYIVMEFVQGNNLHDLIRDHGQHFSQEVIVSVGNRLPWDWPIPTTTELSIAILSPQYSGD